MQNFITTEFINKRIIVCVCNPFSQKMMLKEWNQEIRFRGFCFWNIIISTLHPVLGHDFRENGIAVREGRKKDTQRSNKGERQQWFTWLLAGDSSSWL